MDFRYDDEQELLAKSLRAFVDAEIIPYEDQVEREGVLPKDLVHQIRDRSIKAGFYALNMPVEYGGGGLNFTNRAIAEREFGRASRALQMICNRPALILLKCRDEQIETYLKPTVRGERLECFALTEPGSGSDAPAGITTRAVRHGDDWVINGTKQFITQADRADFIIVFAATGTDTTERGPRKRITAFLVDKDTPGVEVVPLKCVSNRGLVSTLITLTDVRVSTRKILGEEGRGLSTAKEWLFSGRVMLGANCVGLAARAMEMAARWANTRHQFGQPIARFQGTAFKLADMSMEIHAAHLMVLDAAQKMDRGALTQREASQVNLFASEMVGRVTDNALQMFGGMGISEEMPLQRFWRDARVERIWEGASEVHRDVISRDILRRFAD